MNKGHTQSAQQDSGQERSFQILDELANNDALTQRDLSQRLGIALGLVNSYIKNLIAKGYITVATIPPKRYAYYLTPKGFAEKSRLAYDLLQDYTRIYREAKSSYRKLFQELKQSGLKHIVFAGADEVAEIAYITLQETGLEQTARDLFDLYVLGREIRPYSGIRDLDYDTIIVTSYLRRDKIVKELTASGASSDSIRMVFTQRR